MPNDTPKPPPPPPSLRLVIGNKNYSTWSLRPWLLLSAWELPFTEIVEPLAPTETLYHRLVKHSPAAKVPVLIDGDAVIWDSLAICEHVSEQYLDGRGWPLEPTARAAARSVTAEMHSGFAALRTEWPMNIRARRQQELSKYAVRDVARIADIWATYPKAYGSNSGNGGNWLFGDFSIADCFFAPVAMRFLTYITDDSLLPDDAKAYWRRLCNFEYVLKWRESALLETDLVPEDETGTPIND